MTCKTILFYYSRKGNTKALVNLFKGKCRIEKVTNLPNVNLSQYSTVIFATSTYGRGIPPNEFYELRDYICNISNKNIALFGSGNSHYEYFCGALDVLEEMLTAKNNIIFKYKYEGYPKEINFDDMKLFIKQYI